MGIVTVDDAVDVMEQEATEDFEKMAAMIPSEKPYLKTGVFVLAKNRLAWLLSSYDQQHDHRRHPGQVRGGHLQ